MSKRFASLIATAGAVAAIAALLLAGGASGAPSSLPTLNVAVTGKTGISVAENSVPSGAVNIAATFSGTGQGGSFGIIRLNDGVTLQQAIQAVDSHHGDLDALTPFGALIVSANAPGTVQTKLTPSNNYYAINTTGNAPAAASFMVHQNPSPAALPAASSTQKAIDFAFKGSKELTKGTTVRARNKGFMAHMIVLVGARNKDAAKKLAAGLHKGKPQKALRPYENGQFVSLLNPASPGALQQSVLHAKRGYYVEACFLETQDGREHTLLGMERVVHVVK